MVHSRACSHKKNCRQRHCARRVSTRSIHNWFLAKKCVPRLSTLLPRPMSLMTSFCLPPAATVHCCHPCCHSIDSLPSPARPLEACLAAQLGDGGAPPAPLQMSVSRSPPRRPDPIATKRCHLAGAAAPAATLHLFQHHLVHLLPPPLTPVGRSAGTARRSACFLALK